MDGDDGGEKKETCRTCGRVFVPSFSFDFYPDGDGKETGRCEKCVMDEAFAPKPVPEDKLRAVCLFEQGEKTCAFLCMSKSGFVCAKGTVGLNNTILGRWRARTMKADGNNCHGPDADFRLMTPEEVAAARNGGAGG